MAVDNHFAHLEDVHGKPDVGSGGIDATDSAGGRHNDADVFYLEQITWLPLGDQLGQHTRSLASDEEHVRILVFL